MNSLSCTSHQIFAYLSSSGCNFTEKTVNFHAFFGWFSVNISTTTWKILMKLGQKWDKMTTSLTQKTRGHNFKPFWRYRASNIQKSTKKRPKFMDDPKNFRPKFFLAETLSNSPIRKVITLKVKFEDLQKIFPVGGHQSWRHRKFFEFFLDKVQTNWMSWFRTSWTSWSSMTSSISLTKSRSRKSQISWSSKVPLTLRSSPPGRYNSSTSVEGNRSQNVCPSVRPSVRVSVRWDLRIRSNDFLETSHDVRHR